jgi:glycosyltransferase involved in cell wall biosynthesis
MALTSLTVVIPTKNRRASLIQAVKSLSVQTKPPQEVIIVDQTPNRDGTETELRKILPECVRLDYVWDPKISGPAMARNAGMRRTRGDVLLFLDDDLTLYPDFIERLLAAYEELPDATGISGMPDNYEVPGKFFYYWTKIFTRGPFWNDRYPIFWNAKRITRPVRVSQMTSAMMSVKTARLNGTLWDENVQKADAEDVDFCVRLKGVYYVDPRCKMTHHFDPEGRDMDHWTRRHARAYTYLCFKDWRESKLAYAWLNVGWLVAALLGCVSRGSLRPLRAMLAGRAEGRACVPSARAASVRQLRSVSAEASGPIVEPTEEPPLVKRSA